MDGAEKQLLLYKVLEWKTGEGGHTPTDGLTRHVLMQELYQPQVLSFPRHLLIVLWYFMFLYVDLCYGRRSGGSLHITYLS